MKNKLMNLLIKAILNTFPNLEGKEKSGLSAKKPWNCGLEKIIKKSQKRVDINLIRLYNINNKSNKEDFTMRMTLLYYAKDDGGSYIEYEKVEANSYEEAERIGREKFGDDFIEVEEKAKKELEEMRKRSKYHK